MSDQQHGQEHLRQLVHDVQHCLHVIGMATEVLKEVGEDSNKFAEVCACIDKERHAAVKLVSEFLAAAEQQRIED